MIQSSETDTQSSLGNLKQTALAVKSKVGDDHIGLVAAGVAFYALLALFPAITALIAISGLVLDPGDIVGQLDRLSAVMPQAAAEIVFDQASSVAGSREGGLGLAAVAGIGLAIYSASKGVRSLIEGLNIAYDATETRGFIKLTAITLGLTFLLIIGLLAGVMSTIVVPALLSVIDLGGLLENVLGMVRWVILAGLAMVGLNMLYRYGPDRDPPGFRIVTYGSAIACIVWVVASVGFAFYVSAFGSYNESFGSLGGAIILLMWLWISAYIILLGAEINAELEGGG